MEIWQLRYFIQVCKDKSFSQAAKNLHISQQGLSKAVKNLEDQFESSLFNRSFKGVEPTDFGRILLERSKKIVDEFDIMVDFLYEKASINKGEIIMGTPSALYTNVFTNIVCSFEEKYSDINLKIVELESSACEKEMEDNLLDLSLAIKPINTEKFNFIPITTCSIVLLVNKENPLAKKTKVKFSDLKDGKFVMFPKTNKLSQLVIESCMHAGFKPITAFTRSHTESIVELTALDKGIAVVPYDTSQLALKISDKVSVIPFDDPPFNIEIGFIVNKYKKLNCITNILINYFLNYFK